MVQRLLSWRIAIGVGVGAAMIAAGLGVGVGVGVGVAVWVAFSAVPTSTGRPSRRAIDPFTVGEPWRQFVQGALRAADRLHATLDHTRDGPLKDRLATIVERIDHGVDETWRIARRGDEIDDAVNRLDPTALRSKLATTDRLKDRLTKTVNTLRLAQTRMDELVTRAAEISVGAGDTDAYEHDVDDLVIELEALRQAIQEVQTG